MFLIWLLALAGAKGPTSPWKFPHLLADCRVLSTEGVLLRRFPGTICHYLPSGDYFSASPTGLRAFDRQDVLKWEIPGYFHHSLEFTADRTRLLALGSAVYDEQGIMHREDIVMVVSLAGEVLHRRSARELLKLGGGEPFVGYVMPSFYQKLTGAVQEVSHFNSLHAIPPALKTMGEARYVLNGAGHGTYLLNEDLSQVIGRVVMDAQYHGTHDAQVTERGTLLFFNNQVRTGTQMYSAVQEYDLRTKKVIRDATGEPRGLFFSRFGGGVQELDRDRWLFSDNLNGVYLYSHRGKKMLAFLRELHQLDGRDIPVQHVRNVDLTEFLKHHP